MEKSNLKKSTLAIHAGQKASPVEKSQAVAIHRTNSYVFDNIRSLYLLLLKLITVIIY